jgi:hypothetical protein
MGSELVGGHKFIVLEAKEHLQHRREILLALAWTTAGTCSTMTSESGWYSLSGSDNII